MKTLIWAAFALLALIWTGLAALSAGLAQWLIGAMASGEATQMATTVGQWPVPAWAALWIDPAWLQGLQLMWLDLVQWLSQVLPSIDGLGGFVTALVWIGWGVGLITLLVVCGGLHWLAGRMSGQAGVRTASGMSEPLARRLREAADQHAQSPELKLNVRELVQLHGDASTAVLLMLMSALTVIPIAGAGTVLSFAIVALAWAWLRGHDEFPLPRRVGDLTLNETWTRRCLHGLAWTYERAHRWLRPRWPVWSHGATRALWSGWIVVMAGVIFLPLPLGNVLPSISLILLSLGWMARDGLALLASSVVGVAALAYTASLGHVALDLLQSGLERVRPWLGL